MNILVNTTPSDKKSGPLQPYAVLVYGAVAYLSFLAVFLYAIGFIGNLGVSKSLDSPHWQPGKPHWRSTCALLSMFTLQHRVMALRGFKRLITRFIPASAERSTYALASSLALALLFWKWQPLSGVVWQIDAFAGRGPLHGAHACG